MRLTLKIAGRVPGVGIAAPCAGIACGAGPGGGAGGLIAANSRGGEPRAGAPRAACLSRLSLAGKIRWVRFCCRLRPALQRGAAAGGVIVLVTMFTQPEMAQAPRWPLGDPTAPRLVSLSSGVGNNQIGALSGPVVVEVYINGEGQMYDYRIVFRPAIARPARRLRTCC